jgi:hypothetical protein
MGITIAAAVTTLAVVAFYGWLIVRLSAPADRRAMLVAVLVALPLQPLAFYLLRLPLHAELLKLIGSGAALSFIATFYAPLLEEPAKWLVLAVPAVRRALRPDTVVPVALAIGLGFGIGEIWFLAQRVAQAPQYAGLPFWMFGGFFVERFYVTFLHGGFIVFAVARLAGGRPFLPGGLIGMALHYAVNLPIYLAAIGAFGLPAAGWTTVASLLPLLIAALLGVAMNGMSGGRLGRQVLGQSTCPECHAVYPRPLIALNLGPVRYERCPNCRRFHLVRVFAPAKQTRDKDGKA